MRLWKKISIYIIYPILMLAVGFLASVKLHDFFYPSQNAKQEQQYVQDGGNGDTAENQESMEALGTGGAVITCDTRFVVKSLDLTDSSREEEESPIPEQYIGMDRDEFLSAMNSYSESPSLNDLNKGFLSLDVQKFSAQEVVIQKNYESKKKCTEFYLAVENNYVVVYEVIKRQSICLQESRCRVFPLNWRRKFFSSNMWEVRPNCIISLSLIPVSIIMGII